MLDTYGVILAAQEAIMYVGSLWGNICCLTETYNYEKFVQGILITVYSRKIKKNI